jgi:hypothetical protein
MTDYFDQAEREVRERIAGIGDDEAVIESAAAVEGRVVKDVLLCTGDREFPVDLRDKILGLVARRGLVDYAGKLREPKDRSAEAVFAITATRRSELLSDLHSAFHELASRRALARFGWWSDSPSGNLRRRETHDTEGT